MLRNETSKMLAVMSIAYPSYKPQSVTMAIDLWTSMLNNYSYAEVENALKAYIATDTKGFPPSPGQIIDKLHPVQTDELTAWSHIHRALRNSIYSSREEFEKLTEEERRTVGSPENLEQWATQDSESIQVTQSNFCRSYRTTVARMQEERKYPNIVQMIADHKKQIEEKSEGLNE